MTEQTTTPEAVEDSLVKVLLAATQQFLDVQMLTQPDEASILRHALRNSAGYELQVRIGPLPSLRMVLINADDREGSMIRSIDLGSIELLAEG